MSRSTLAWSSVYFGLLVVVVLAYFFGFAFVENLVLGWLYFPIQNLTRTTLDWASIAVGLTSCLLLVLVIHGLLRRSRTSAEGAGGRRWSLRSTLALSMLLILCFVSGTAIVGLLHNSIWLAAQTADRARPPREIDRTFGLIDTAQMATGEGSQKNSLEILSMGIDNHKQYYRRYPPGGTMTEHGELLHGWAGILAGHFFLGYGSEEIDFFTAWNKPPNARIFRCNVADMINPAMGGPYFDDQGFGLAHIAGNIRTLPIVEVRRPPRSSDPKPFDEKFKPFMTLGLPWLPPVKGEQQQSNAVMVGTVGSGFKPWGHPLNLRDPRLGIGNNPDQFGGPESWRGAMFAMRDGSVQFFNHDIDPRILEALSQ